MRLGSCLHGRHVAIDAGVISGADNPDDVGQDLFLVLLVERDGSYEMLWGGRSRLEAVRTAGEMASVLGLPVVDKTGRPN